MPSDPNDRVDALINEYFDRKQAGEALTPEAFAAEHRDLADDLLPFLQGLSLLEQVRGQLHENEDADAPAGDDGGRPALPGYELIEEIGHGGMGVVYKAMQVATRRVVAIKVVLAGSFASASVRRRFQREVQLAARLQHPHIVRVLESGTVEREQYYAMDYVEGVALDRYVRETRPDLGATLRIFIRLCAAVDYAHGHGVVHRDLKPANVLIDGDGAPHILDFGLAKALDQPDPEAQSLTRVSAPGQVMGTLPYIAPEQAAGATADVDARADVYALGVMLYEALTGAAPFDLSGQPSDIIRRILEEPPRATGPHPKALKGDLETIVLKALEKERERRYASARDLADDLRRYLEGEPILARRPSRAYVIRKKIRKHPLVSGLGTAAVVAAVAAIVLAAGALRQRRQQFDTARRQALIVQAAIDLGDPERAMVNAQGLLSRSPRLPEAPLVCAQAYCFAGRQEDAISLLVTALKWDPSRWPCRALLAEIYRSMGETVPADAGYEVAERDAPDTAEAWYLRSFATLDRARALRFAETAVDREPSFYHAWYRLTDLRLNTGDLDGAIEGARTILALGEEPTRWRLYIAQVQVRQRRFEPAIGQLTRAIQDRPGEPHLLRQRAHVRRRMKDHEGAVSDYTQVLDGAEEKAAVVWDHYQRATPLWILGRAEEAAEDYRQVRMLLGRPFYADARRHIILRELGRDDEARAVLDAALRDVDDDWLRQIFRCLAGRITPDDLIADARRRANPEQLCEAHYYAAETLLLAGAVEEAQATFARCVETGIDFDPDTALGTPMNEFELAQWRMGEEKTEGKRD